MLSASHPDIVTIPNSATAPANSISRDRRVTVALDVDIAGG
ncbi:hypothetical protein [Azospirillum brasilense]|nr:hypothetical protein [Azospirillum brasilense]